MVEASRHRFLRISRGADQRSRTLRVPLPHHGPVATHAPAAQSTRPHHVGTDHAAGRRLSPQTPRSSPLAKCALCRQAPEVGAECPNRARSDRCGGHSVMSVPTAIRRLADRDASNPYTAASAAASSAPCAASDAASATSVHSAAAAAAAASVHCTAPTATAMSTPVSTATGQL